MLTAALQSPTGYSLPSTATRNAAECYSYCSEYEAASPLASLASLQARSSFSPKPKIESSVLIMKPKIDFFNLKDPKNLEKLTRVFFMHRRKMLKKSYNLLFNGNLDIANKLNIDLKLRPQNLNFETYYKLSEEYNNLSG